jgi:hypothetical protein
VLVKLESYAGVNSVGHVASWLQQLLLVGWCSAVLLVCCGECPSVFIMGPLGLVFCRRGEKGCCAEFTFLHVERQWAGFLTRAARAYYGGGSQHKGSEVLQRAKAMEGLGDGTATEEYQPHDRRRRAYR